MELKGIDGKKMLEDALKQIKTVDDFVNWACLFIDDFPKIRVKRRKDIPHTYIGYLEKDKERMRRLFSDDTLADGNFEAKKLMFEIVNGT